MNADVGTCATCHYWWEFKEPDDGSLGACAQNQSNPWTRHDYRCAAYKTREPLPTNLDSSRVEIAAGCPTYIIHPCWPRATGECRWRVAEGQGDTADVDCVCPEGCKDGDHYARKEDTPHA